MDTTTPTPSAADPHAEAPDRTLTTPILTIFAAACGLSVANVYYAQPLLDEIAADLGIRPSSVGLVITLTQIGYALGLLFIVPLGDLVDRRRLVITQGVLSSIALAVVGTAPSAVVMLGAMIVVGLLAVVVQVLVAFTAALSVPEDRGRNVGFVTSGVVIGILLARLAAGLLADLGGWRAVYLTSAASMLAMSLLLSRVLPRHRAAEDGMSYAALLWSVPRLFREEPLVRVRVVLAFLIFATFSTLWTALVFPLSAPPLSLTHTSIGLFGLAGIAGAVAASGAGRLADRGWGQATTGWSLALMTAAWALIAMLPASLIAAIAGIILIDFAVQAVHVTNQSMIFAVRPEAQSRLVGGYMIFYSLGSATGSIASTATYAAAGWSGVCALGASLGLASLLFWSLTRHVGAGRSPADHGVQAPSKSPT